MLELLSIGSHSSKCCPAVKEKVQVDVMQAHVALAWGRPPDVIADLVLLRLTISGSSGSIQLNYKGV